MEPNVHIICGFCGKNHGFKYAIRKNFVYGQEETKVLLLCTNCGQQTYLDAIVEKSKE